MQKKKVERWRIRARLSSELCRVQSINDVALIPIRASVATLISVLQLQGFTFTSLPHLFALSPTPQKLSMSSSAASSAERSSKALIRKSTDTDLMPPPPVKRIKRPPKVLDEDTYTDALVTLSVFLRAPRTNFHSPKLLPAISFPVS